MIQPIAKKVTSVNMLEGALNFFSVIPEAFKAETRKDALTDEFDGIAIDTCLCADTKVWETGICREDANDGNWVIATQYDDKAEAQEGHKQWVKYLKENPTCELTDINMWNFPEDDEVTA